MAEEGAAVAVVGLTAERGEAVAAQIRETGGTAPAYGCDVAALDAVESVGGLPPYVNAGARCPRPPPRSSGHGPPSAPLRFSRAVPLRPQAVDHRLAHTSVPHTAQ
ncbi:hypothetical protein [Streptomyces sp. NA02950]|uniref:hypothetical protein n=1 Tax=Streptomyces sp. NA02950 TaxID=2742137 RepID=UPI0020CB00B7|nr:hypothetical protein [Streptomyces sp. NA02950]